MKIFLTLLFSLIGCVLLNAQPSKVAILDFENTSGKTEYDALGKAISSMLITDLANNIHPKKVEFFERSQLNKLLEEQKLQKSKNFDTKTAVDFGKLSGVNYVFVGSVFVLDGTCNFSSKLVDVQTSKILLAEDVSGKIEAWLQLKSQLAEAIANQLNNPITLDPYYKDQSTTLATLNQYGKILTTMDGGDGEKAEQMRSLFEETNPDFKYFSALKDEIEKLNVRVLKLENVTNILVDAFQLGYISLIKKNYSNSIKYFGEFLANPGKSEFFEVEKLFAFTYLAEAYFKSGDYLKAQLNARKAIQIYPYFPKANELELLSLISLNEFERAVNKYNFIIDSLIIINEYNFAVENKNPSLIWEIKDIGGNRTEEHLYILSSPMVYYAGLLQVGYGKMGYGNLMQNKKSIEDLLAIYNLDLSIGNKQLSIYEKTESKLEELSVNDPSIFKIDYGSAFGRDRLSKFYKLSFEYSQILKVNSNIKGYIKHIEKEINRMEGFGIQGGMTINKQQVNSDSVLWQIMYNSFGYLGDLFKTPERDLFLSSTGIFCNFMYNYLIVLVKNNRLREAVKIFSRIKNKIDSDRNSFFYQGDWGLYLLGSGNFMEEDYSKNINETIMKDVGLDLFEKLKFEYNNAFLGTTTIKVENNNKLDTLVWSKNIGVIVDGIGNEIKQVTSWKAMYQSVKDSVPAYCFFDFNGFNGEEFGKLYNYWAYRLILKNPPNGWRMPSNENFYNYFDHTKIFLHSYFKIEYEKFAGIDYYFHYWTSNAFRKMDGGESVKYPNRIYKLEKNTSILQLKKTDNTNIKDVINSSGFHSIRLIKF